MTLSYKHYIALAVALVAFFAFSFSAFANPLRFPPGVSSGTATTSLVFLIAPNATTTLATYDSYSNNGVAGNGGSTQALDKVAILLQTTASTTGTITYATVQHSQDGIDWYGDEVVSLATPASINIGQPNIYQFTALGTTRESRVLSVEAPLRFIRLNVWNVGANGAVWASIQPQKQNP